jgi:hypothetical protein
LKRAIIATILAIALLFTGCGRVVTVSHKRFGAHPVDVRNFVTPESVDHYSTETAAWRALEDGYVYESDDWSLYDCDNTERIPSGNDFWLYPVETQYLIDKYPMAHAMDCEDGAAWLASSLKKLGLDAWFCVGTVIVDGNIYGHAWTMVLEDGKWKTYETTVNEIVDGLPDIYSINWRTNGQTTWVNYLSTGIELTITQLPVSELSSLKKSLGG